MNVDDYLDAEDPDGTRLKGHRIWLNDILYELVFNYRTLLWDLATLSLPAEFTDQIRYFSRFDLSPP